MANTLGWNSVQGSFGASTAGLAQASRTLEGRISTLENLSDRISTYGKEMEAKATAEKENILAQQGKAISNQALLDAVDENGTFHQDRYAASITRSMEQAGVQNYSADEFIKLQANIDTNTSDQLKINAAQDANKLAVAKLALDTKKYVKGEDEAATQTLNNLVQSSLAAKEAYAKSGSEVDKTKMLETEAAIQQFIAANINKGYTAFEGQVLNYNNASRAEQEYIDKDMEYNPYEHFNAYGFTNEEKLKELKFIKNINALPSNAINQAIITAAKQYGEETGASTKSYKAMESMLNKSEHFHKLFKSLAIRNKVNIADGKELQAFAKQFIASNDELFDDVSPEKILNSLEALQVGDFHNSKDVLKLLGYNNPTLADAEKVAKEIFNQNILFKDTININQNKTNITYQKRLQELKNEEQIKRENELKELNQVSQTNTINTIKNTINEVNNMSTKEYSQRNRVDINNYKYDISYFRTNDMGYITPMLTGLRHNILLYNTFIDAIKQDYINIADKQQQKETITKLYYLLKNTR